MDYAALLKQYLREEEGDAVYLEDPSLFFAAQKPTTKPASPLPPLPLPSLKKVVNAPVLQLKELQEEEPAASILVPKTPKETLPDQVLSVEDSFLDIQSSMRKHYPSFKILPLPKVKHSSTPPLILFMRSKTEQDIPFWQGLIKAIEQNIASVEEHVVDQEIPLQNYLEECISNKLPKCVLTAPSLSTKLPPSDKPLRYFEGAPLLALEAADHYEQNATLKRKLWNFLKTFS